MFGMEVAGLVLGVVPVLIEAIAGYQRGLDKLTAGLRKRKIIKKLGHALEHQNCIVGAITRNVLAQSGCETISQANNAELRSLLQNKHTQELVEDFLGTHNAKAFTNALEDCLAGVSRATVRLASLVPSLASVKNTDVQAILTANDACEKGQIHLSARLYLIFHREDLEDEIEALDRSTNSLNKLTQNIIPYAHHESGQTMPSKKATKLAKALQGVRQDAVNLHSALTQQWVTPCHQRHELRVFLEDRTTELKPNQAKINTRSSCFKVIFVGGISQPTDLWTETLFHIEAEDTLAKMTSPVSQGPRIRFSTPQQQPVNHRLSVPDICAAITDTTSTQYYPIFYLAGTKDIAMTLHTQAAAATPGSQCSSTTLQKIFQDYQDQNSPLPLKWQWCMGLALKVASSFLQFAQTPWVQPSWSASNIHIPYTAGTRKLDLAHPFISADFSKNPPSLANRHAQIKEDLLELGILLLEIWYGQNFEIRFAQQLGMITRRACALEWLNDVENAPCNFYSRATSHCVIGYMTHTSNSLTWEWDHLDLWKSVCENVIDPLLQLQ